MKRNSRTISVVFALILATGGILCFNSDIGTAKNAVEGKARTAQKIQTDWLAETDATGAMSAVIFYPEDLSAHAFSVYINHPGLSFGYFPRGSGNTVAVAKHIAEFTVEGYEDHAFVSMNKQRVERMEVNDGKSIKTTAIDSHKPFALVLPKSAGSITFFDVNGKAVDAMETSL